MHEFSLTQSLLDTALKNSNSKRIVQVNLLIGPYSDEREESIRLYWRDLAKGTLGEGAKLHFQYAKTEMKCLACGGTFSFDGGSSLCEYCQNDRLQTEEVKIESIEVE